MKKLAFTMMVAVLVLTGCSASNSAVEVLDAPTWIQKTQDLSAQIIDVRTAEEYNAGHLANAINIDVESGNFESQISTLDKNATYSLYCHSGRRSAIAAEKMEKAGFGKIVNLQGGMVDLLSAGAQLG